MPSVCDNMNVHCASAISYTQQPDDVSRGFWQTFVEANCCASTFRPDASPTFWNRCHIDIMHIYAARRPWLFVFLVVAFMRSYLHFDDAYTPLPISMLTRRWDRERRAGRWGRGKGMKGANRGGDPKRAFFKAPHRSAATDRPANRSTANKSRRFLRRAARVRSCPVFGNRSDEEEHPFSSRMGGRGEGADQQRAARSLELFLAAV